MNIGVSPMTNRIYAGKSKDLGNGIRSWIGKKEDITNEAIRAVFGWFINNYEEKEPCEEFELKFENCPYILSLKKGCP